MKIHRIIYVLTLLISTQILYAQDEKFSVTVQQFGKEVKAVNAIYELKSDEFTLQFTVENMDAILVGATFDEDVYESAKGEGDLEVGWFENTGMAEVQFNAEKQILISNDAPSYWYFDSEDDHRFDKHPIQNSSQWTATRASNKFDDLLNDKIISVKNFNESLYLVFYTKEYGEDTQPNIKATLAIRFNKN